MYERAKRHYESRTKEQLGNITKQPKRDVSYIVSVNLHGQQIFISKVVFLAVHGLQHSVKRIDLLARKLKNGVSIPKGDGRGKHKHHKRIETDALDMVRHHSEICKPYLDCDMTILGLYRKYVQWIGEKKQTI